MSTLRRYYSQLACISDHDRFVALVSLMQFDGHYAPVLDKGFAYPRKYRHRALAVNIR
ncbi:MAG TPA: hypothetical protein VN753_02105 [Terracidiphilus sp.]|nr:hypothetical protein [Terracidiphilus sp.]